MKRYRCELYIDMLFTGVSKNKIEFHSYQGVTTHDIRCKKGLDIRLISVDILDIRPLDSVETWLFSALFQVFHSLTTGH